MSSQSGQPLGHFQVVAEDRELFERLVGSFVPPVVFDAHAHLYRVADLHKSGTCIDELGPQVADHAAFVRDLESWMGARRPSEGLFIPFPARQGDMPAGNDFLRQQIKDRPGSRGLYLIHPKDDPAAVERQLDAFGWAGFKVYHVYSPRTAGKTTSDATIGEYLPEWAWELAQARGLAITLHMVRDRALADEDNQRYIREHCRRYPNARLILAHAARGFCGNHTVIAIDSLRGLDNVWFDTSAICEPQAFEAIFRAFGSWRLMYGADYPVCQFRGRCVSVADGFLWLDPTNTKWSDGFQSAHTLIGIESLLALKQAATASRLSDGDVERLFAGAAHALFGIGASTGGTTGPDLYAAARKIIPGGVQLLSKRPEMYAPEQWPAYYSEARGCTIIDMDGRSFIDMTTNGVGACLLGYNHPEVTSAVVRRVQHGSFSTLNNPEEPALARGLIDLHPWAGGVRLRSGGETMAMAVRIARARTGRDAVAFCGYHGWSDWYLAANLASTGALDQHLIPGLSPSGVPRGLNGSAVPFAYNDFAQLKAAVERCGKNLAAIVMEPVRNFEPAPGFLEAARDAAHKAGALLVFDEITAGFRFRLGGSHLQYGVTPDIAAFAKALGSGHPIGAVVGTADAMAAAQGSFISSTYWTEGVGYAAGLATLGVMRRLDVPAHVERIGMQFRAGLARLAEKCGLPLGVTGRPALNYLAFNRPDGHALMTLFTARMLRHGFLAGAAFYPTLGHEAHHVERFLAAAEEVFAELAEAAAKGDAEKRIGGPVKHTGFARLN